MNAPAHVVVIGAGFAGLSCAVALAARGTRVTVLEARRTLGGRAGSFVDEATGEVVDNGQHLFMACYHETRRFLDTIGTGGRIRYQKRLMVDYIRRGFRVRLKCPPLPAPWHLVSGVLTMKGLTRADRVALMRAAPALRRLAAGGEQISALETVSVTAWLDHLEQTENLRRWLWHPLAIATLNQSPDTAPASLLAAVLNAGFMGRASDSGLGVATVGLGELYTDASRGYLEQRGGAVRTGVAVSGLEVSGGRVTAALMKDGARLAADAFVSAMPPAALARLGIPGLDTAALDAFASSPILSVNLWFDRPVSAIADFEFAGLVDARVQWLFNKERILEGRATHLAAVVSAAADLVTLGNDELAALVEQDVRAALPAASGAKVTRFMVVRERSATFAATVDTEKLRPGHVTPYANLLLAGDWTERGMPATIETAVRTGHRCAGLLAAAPPP